MPYAKNQYSPAKAFVRGGDDHIADPDDKLRCQCYDLYESIYVNSSSDLKLLLRGDDSYPILMPSGRKIIEATHRFLAQGFEYLVEPDFGSDAARADLNAYLQDMFKREAMRAKHTGRKRWGLIHADAFFYIYADSNKPVGKRVSIAQLDPRNVFKIEDGNGRLTGYHLVDIVQDFRSPDDKSKKLSRRRTFRRVVGDNGEFTGTITSELTYWDGAYWDDRGAFKEEERAKKRVVNINLDQEAFALPEFITALPVYHWRNKPPMNSSWGTSQLEGMETLMYALNQSLTDEDATIVFQGLGMYVTNASPPIDPNTGELTDWNIGPMQIIEVPGARDQQYFERVSGVQDVSPFQDHMAWLDDKGISEGSGTPQVAIGRVDVQSVESGISLELQFKPLIAQNAEKEEEMVVVDDQMLHDLVTMWLPSYEIEYGTGAFTFEEMSACSVVVVFADPMPINKEKEVQNTILLQTSHLILRKMAVAKLRALGWEFPEFQEDGVTPLSDQDIADMLVSEAETDASLGLSALDAATGQTDPNAGNTGSVPGQ